jgi:hypothetical protein
MNMSLRITAIWSIAFFVISGLATYFWVEPIASPGMRRSGSAVMRSAPAGNPLPAPSSVPKISQPTPKVPASVSPKLRTGKFMTVMIDPEDPVDIVGIRETVMMDIEYCLASDLKYREFWSQLGTKEKAERWNEEFRKTPGYYAIWESYKATLANYPDYWATDDIATKKEIIKWSKLYKDRMEPVIRPLIQRAMAENPSMRPPAADSFITGHILSPSAMVNSTGGSGLSPAGVPPPPPEKPPLFQ